MDGGRPDATARVVAQLVIDQVAELVEEPDRDAPASRRDPDVDRVALPKAVGPGLAGGRGRTYRHDGEVGTKAVQGRRRRQRSNELGRERTPPRQRDDVLQRAQPGRPLTGHAARVAAACHGRIVGTRPDGVEGELEQVVEIVLDDLRADRAVPPPERGAEERQQARHSKAQPRRSEPGNEDDRESERAADGVAAVDLAYKAAVSAPYHHLRPLGIAGLAAVVIVALVALVPRIPSRTASLGAGLAAGGA